jgi:hypothetical protein
LEATGDELFNVLNLQEMMNSTKQVLASSYWPRAPLETVLDLMEIDDSLEASEVEIVKALVKWGKAQVQFDGDDPEDGDKLRQKIEPCLKLIRFKGMDHTEFAQLAYAELKNCFSVDEKFAIVSSIALGDWNLMPAQFTPQKDPRPPSSFYQPSDSLIYNWNLSQHSDEYI